MTKLDVDLLKAVQEGLDKKAFVPMPGGQAEPVAGASPATAAMAGPMAAPPGSPAAQGAPPQGGMPPQGGVAAPQPAPPELTQMLQDPMVQQALNQAGIMIQPDGSAIDGMTGQPIPPEALMQGLQEMMGEIQGGAPGGAPAGAPAEGGAPMPEEMPAEEADPTIELLTEIRDLLKSNKEKSDGGESKSDGEGGEGSDLSRVAEELSRTNEMLRSMLGGGEM